MFKKILFYNRGLLEAHQIFKKHNFVGDKRIKFCECGVFVTVYPPQKIVEKISKKLGISPPPIKSVYNEGSEKLLAIGNDYAIVLVRDKHMYFGAVLKEKLNLQTKIEGIFGGSHEGS